ncbi:MAG TPA: choice-of-anchor tandem repeat GloVer-containing protein [Verrucomicrobiae bacterium]|nr:choice-of-anchor tandem repeat GloVer-containing protein [Verrucomicrobiae bacterium]
MNCKNRSLVRFLILGLSFVVANQIKAQSVTNLHYFDGIHGSRPYAGALLSGNTLYGTTANGGPSGNGTVFAVNIDGSEFRTLYSFSGTEGATPYGGLVLSGDTLFGTTLQGGSWSNGIVFAINTTGSGLKILHQFTSVAQQLGPNADGANPSGELVLAGSTLYGTTPNGGANGLGTLFAVTTDGLLFTNLHSFGGFTAAVPSSGLVLSGDTLYGTTTAYGLANKGTVFSIKTDGSGFLILHEFDQGVGSPLSYSNKDGGFPGPLTLWSNVLYGAAEWGGAFGNGTIFTVNTDCSAFRMIHTFTATSGNSLANEDGALPMAKLLVSGNTLFGVAPKGGRLGGGTAFAINLDGLVFSPLHSFTRSDGLGPNSLVLSDGKLYGTATIGGVNNYGTVFSLSLPLAAPVLAEIAMGENLILTWPTNFPGFTLQCTTNLGPSAVWTSDTPVPVTVNGQITVTNPISGTQRFFRLSQ